MENNLVRKYFYKWIQYNVDVRKKRQQIIDATIFRYKHIFRQVSNQIIIQAFSYMKISKQYNSNIRLYRKVFQSFKLITHKNDTIVEYLQRKRKFKIYKAFFKISKQIVDEGVVQDAVLDVYNQKLLYYGYQNFKKAVKISKTYKQKAKLIRRRRKQVIIDKWLLQLQNKRFYEELNKDSNLFFQQNFIKKCFKRWVQFVTIRQEEKKQRNLLSVIFTKWKMITKKSNQLLACRFKDVHSKYLIKNTFIQWKEAAIENQKLILARQFQLYKLFRYWKEQAQLTKQIEESLIDKELILTLALMKRRKRKYFYKIIDAFNFGQEQKKSIEMLIQINDKKRIRYLVWAGFRGFKINWLQKHYQEMKTIRKIMKIFNVLKQNALKIKDINNYVDLHIKQNQKKIITSVFEVFNKQRADLQAKIQRAKNFYNSRLIKYFFHHMISSLISSYTQNKMIGQQFQKQRKLIFCFRALQTHAIDKIKQRAHKNLLKQYQGFKQFRFLKKLFIKLKQYSIVESKFRKRMNALKYNAFYQLRLRARLAHIQ
ncbi:hypothetical protein pb186bvf_018436 [Paramecium bursaria]